MNKTVSSILFVIAVIFGGPLMFLAASFAALNLIRGILLAIPGIFNYFDFGFLINAIPFLISVAIMYGILLGVMWLGNRALGVSGAATDEDAYARSGKWLTVLLTLFAVSVLTAIVTIYLLWDSSSFDLFTLFTEGSTGQLALLILAGIVYQPLALAVFSIAMIRSEIEPAGTNTSTGTTVGLVSPPAVVIVWLIAMTFSGNLF